MLGRRGGPGGQEQEEPTTRRGQRQEDRHEFGVGGNSTRNKMKEKLISFGDDFWIEDEGGRKAFKVDGKMLRVRDILAFEDDRGQVLVEMASKLIQIKDQVKLERKGGRGAVVKKDLINVVHDHFIMKVDGGADIDIRGNILDHEYSLSKGRDKSPRFQRNGSASVTPMASRSSPARTISSSWLPPWPLTSCHTTLTKVLRTRPALPAVCKGRTLQASPWSMLSHDGTGQGGAQEKLIAISA